MLLTFIFPKSMSVARWGVQKEQLSTTSEITSEKGNQISSLTKNTLRRTSSLDYSDEIIKSEIITHITHI